MGANSRIVASVVELRFVTAIKPPPARREAFCREINECATVKYRRAVTYLEATDSVPRIRRLGDNNNVVRPAPITSWFTSSQGRSSRCSTVRRASYCVISEGAC